MASIAAASADNDVCAVGIAPDAILSSCKVVGDGLAPEESDSSFLYLYMENMHVFDKVTENAVR